MFAFAGAFVGAFILPFALAFVLTLVLTFFAFSFVLTFGAFGPAQGHETQLGEKDRFEGGQSPIFQHQRPH